MKISENLSSYLSTFLQGTQKTSTSASTGSTQSATAGISSADTVQISGEAYDSLSGGGRTGQMPPPMDPSQVLSGLVDDGTISSDQADAITTAIQNAMNGESTSGSTETSTDSDTTDTNPLESLLDNLVSDGTLTEDQASAVGQAMTPPPTPQPMGIGGPGGAGGIQPSDSDSEDETAAGSTSDTSDSTTATSTTDSDESTDLIKDIVNSLLDNGTNSTGSISSLLQVLNSLDTSTLKSVYADLNGSTSSSNS